MNDKIPKTIRQVLRAAPAAALATGIVSPAALGDPGDLDPTFADVGRFTPPPDDRKGRAQSIVLQDDDYVFAGGGLAYGFYETDTLGFADRLSVDGAFDAAFDAPDLANTLVIDVEVQPDDGKIVGIGRRDDVFIVFRLERDGALDAGFGVDGVRVLIGVSDLGSIAADPAGAIVVAGSLAGNLKIVRLLANGDLDDSFGTAGVFTAPADAADEIQALPRVLSMEGGGYRITDNDYDASGMSRCRVLALTADGTVDETFGDHGYAGLASTSDMITCDAMIESPDGGLLVSGADGLKPVLIKLIANGAPDPAFAVDALANTSMIKAATVDIDANTGAIAVAGYGPSDIAGFPVVRLHSNGSLDPLFGSGGETWVDLPPGRPHPFVSDLIVLPNSDVLIAGGSYQGIYFNAAFVTRLVGGDDKDSPGVIGVLNTGIEASEDGQQAIVTVRRVGGKTGSVSVAYATLATSSDAFHATEGDDFTALTDRLTWADGDVADKQFSVPIGADDGAPEEREDFDVELSDVQGGAGLGTSITTVSIASDATDAGMFAVESDGLQVNEGDRTAQVYISRNYSWSGAVTVTVTLASDTATAGDDFAADPLTVSWGDGDSEWKLVDIPIVNDSARESSEQFTLQLSDPTGGAVVGPRSTASVTVSDDDAAPPPATGGGGGLIGIGSLLWLGILRWLRISRDRRRPKPLLAPG